MRRFISKLLGRDRAGAQRPEGTGPEAARGGDGETPDESTGKTPAEPLARVLDGPERDALSALREGLTALANFLPGPPADLRGSAKGPRDLPPADLLALQDRETIRLGRDLRALAHFLVESATSDDGDPGPENELGSAAERVRDRAERLPTPEGGRRPRRKHGGRTTGRDLRSLLREIAAEHHGLVVEITEPGENGDEDVAIAWRPGRPEALDLCLLERVLQRLEAAVRQTDLLFLQRRISRWWFERFSAPGRGAPEKFGRRVREMEWAFLDRPVPGIGGPVVEAFVRQNPTVDLPRRQASLLDRLQGSLVSGFEVLERAGSRAVFEDLARRGRYEVTEHNEEIDYAPGEVALGRLIPGDGVAWRRSPGMVFVGTDPGGLARAVREGLRRADRDEVPRSIAVEGTLLAVLSDDSPPRKIRPTLTRKLAKDLSRRTVELLEEAGLAEPTTDRDVADEVERMKGKRPGPGQVRGMTLTVDEVTADWLAALDAQGRGMF